jgi:hypothetical protein
MPFTDKIKSAFTSVKGVVVSTTEWVKTISSEPNGNGSSSRMIALIVTVTLMGVLAGFFHVHHDLPTPGQLYGLASILGTGIGGYIANKLRPKDDGSDQGGGNDSH